MLKIDFSQAITAEARAAEELARSAAAARAEALAYLASTDWMVVRQAETGEAVPEDVLARRAEARKVASA
jgi:hypothetical protein